jgi:hypothetical protein
LVDFVFEVVVVVGSGVVLEGFREMFRKYFGRDSWIVCAGVSVVEIVDRVAEVDPFFFFKVCNFFLDCLLHVVELGFDGEILGSEEFPAKLAFFLD